MPILIAIGFMIGWLSRRRRRETAIIRAVLGALPEPASVKDMSGRYRFVNAALERVLELSDTDVLGRTASGLQPATVAARVDEGDRKVIETLRPYEFEVEATVPGVDPMVMRMVKAPVLDERGRLVGIVTMGHDITERVEHERSLARMASDARDEYERARADYARLIRHRLANPLTIIEGAAHALLLDYSENRANRELLGRLISEQVHRLARLDLQANRAGDEERELEALSTVDADEVLRAMQVFGAEFREIDGADPSTSTK